MKIIVEGKLACFTSPLERGMNKVTYDIPTVTAVEGILKSIFWKPAIKYKINKIIVFNPIKKTTIGISRLTNFSDTDRTIIGVTCLQDVKYGIDFDVIPVQGFVEQNPEKHTKVNYTNQISDRLREGDYFRLPHLGLSLFPCSKITHIHSGKGFPLDEISPSLQKKSITYNNVIYKMEFNDKYNYSKWKHSDFDNTVKTVWCFNPVMNGGIIDIKEYEEKGKKIYESYNRIV